MGYSSDGLPHVGAVPGRLNQLMLAGFSGHGMPQVFLSAKGIAAMVMDDGLSFSETGIPRAYETSKERLDNPRNSILEAWEENQTVRQSRL